MLVSENKSQHNFSSCRLISRRFSSKGPGGTKSALFNFFRSCYIFPINKIYYGIYNNVLVGL